MHGNYGLVRDRQTDLLQEQQLRHSIRVRLNKQRQIDPKPTTNFLKLLKALSHCLEA